MGRDLRADRMPEHVAIVMDGNGRWAQSRGLPRMAGHRAGMEALREIVKRSDVLGVKHLTVYAFSTENWRRPEEEVSGIFKLLIFYVEKELAELHKNNVRVSILGDWKQLPGDSVQKIEEALATTSNNTGLQFHIALNYGGRDDILQAARQLAAEAAAGELAPESVDAAALSDRLYTAGIPDPDLLIRTSGELRLSNFLLWQCAYSEFVFMDTLWPDFTPDCLEAAIEEYQKRDRRFGGR